MSGVQPADVLANFVPAVEVESTDSGRTLRQIHPLAALRLGRSAA